jgi:hypothetical protein
MSRHVWPGAAVAIIDFGHRNIAAARRNNNKATTPTMIYLKWTPSELATLRAGALYTEVDEDGWVQRELGIGDDGLVTHQLVPSDSRPGWFGLARLSLMMLSSNVTKAEFESLWHAGSAATEP